MKVCDENFNQYRTFEGRTFAMKKLQTVSKIQFTS